MNASPLPPSSAILVCIALLFARHGNARIPVPAGAGAYAFSVPSFDAQVDEYYGLGAQQIIDLYPGLHLDPSLANRPIPSNKWWTDVLIGDRSYYDANDNPQRVVAQDPFGGQLWSFPAMLAPASGFGLYFPNSWVTGAPPQGGFNAGAELPVTGPTNNGSGAFAATQSVVTGWSDWGFQFKLPDAAGNFLQMTLARGVPFVWLATSGVQPCLNPGAVTLYDTNNRTISTATGAFTNNAFSLIYNGARAYRVLQYTTYTVTNTSDPAGQVLLDDVNLSTSAPGPANALAVTASPGWVISWPSADYATYGLKRASQLNGTNGWTDFGQKFSGNGGQLSVFDPATTNRFQFYQLYAQP